MSAIELTPAEQAAMQTDSHVAFCQTPLGQCVACMAVYRRIKKVIAAIEPVITEQATKPLKERLEAVKAVLADGRVTYSLNNADDPEVRAGRKDIRVLTPMMTETAAVRAALDLDGAPVAAGAEALEGAAAAGEPEGVTQQ